jgi:hypothetical protein
MGEMVDDGKRAEGEEEWWRTAKQGSSRHAARQRAAAGQCRAAMRHAVQDSMQAAQDDTQCRTVQDSNAGDTQCRTVQATRSAGKQR